MFFPEATAGDRRGRVVARPRLRRRRRPPDPAGPGVRDRRRARAPHARRPVRRQRQARAGCRSGTCSSYTFLDDLAPPGSIRPAVDLVVHTHLHADHVGWDTRLVDGTWVPTFPSARHLYTERELDQPPATTAPAARRSTTSTSTRSRRSSTPGSADIVAEDEDLGDGLRLEPDAGPHARAHVVAVDRVGR